MKGNVKYDCGNGAGCVIKNPGVRLGLEKLGSQISADGAGELVVTRGDSYVGEDGRVYSHSTGQHISGRGSNSFHNDNRGNRGVDIRSESLTIDQSKIPAYIKTASGGDFKVFISPKYTNEFGVYRNDGHIHLTCNSAACIGRN